ncbi:hypothetical protein BU23DRAFT_626756 [Bimuria novae-zelandiae CBS 107.79]|uniref:Uncharacterized protein n=1 Tax=Bimuria novae-zelandiae CBS 107.79 TaxID=1447943 RepID=A0A6A5UXM2_9PLEO|nr:hypothetical protein BU23DRAFT_626756 [Bimuria novae-zelandiae CBS 107.79]
MAPFYPYITPMATPIFPSANTQCAPIATVAVHNGTYKHHHHHHYHYLGSHSAPPRPHGEPAPPLPPPAPQPGLQNAPAPAPPTGMSETPILPDSPILPLARSVAGVNESHSGVAEKYVRMGTVISGML